MQSAALYRRVLRESHIGLQWEGAIIVLHQRGIQQPILWVYVAVPKGALPQWGTLISQAIYWVQQKVTILMGEKPESVSIEIAGDVWVQYLQNSPAVQTSLEGFFGEVRAVQTTSLGMLCKLLTAI